MTQAFFVPVVFVLSLLIQRHGLAITFEIDCNAPSNWTLFLLCSVLKIFDRHCGLRCCLLWTMWLFIQAVNSLAQAWSVVGWNDGLSVKWS